MQNHLNNRVFSEPIMKLTSMINSRVACCSDLLEFVYNLSKTDILVLYSLSPGAWSRSKEIAGYVSRDESTVFRSLQKLTGLKLVLKDYRIIPGGGYFYEYTLNDTGVIQELMDNTINDITSRMKSLLSDMITEFNLKKSYGQESSDH